MLFAALRLSVIAALLVAPAQRGGRSVVIPAADGTMLTGVVYEASERPAPAVVLVHMLGRSREDWRVIATRLQDAGITALAIDLRGHGQSTGDRSALPAMVGDVESAIQWLKGRQETYPRAVAVVGASLGANLAALAAAGQPDVRAVALVSPSLDYRGVRLDAGLMKRLQDRAVWLAASTEDPYALRTVKELTSAGHGEQQLSGMRGHGTTLLNADPEVARGLVDWLRARLVI